MYVLRRPGVAKFAEIIKILTMFIKKVFKDFKNVKNLEILYQNFPPFPPHLWATPKRPILNRVNVNHGDTKKNGTFYRLRNDRILLKIVRLK